jgi:pyridoxamine 5'-phosphate oxidase
MTRDRDAQKPRPEMARMGDEDPALDAPPSLRQVSRLPETPLDEDRLGADPLAEFRRWYDEAREVEQQPDAMALATAGSDGRPTNRMVLLKGVDGGGFVFFTNYESAKGEDLARNPRAALVFFWYRLHRQVRVEGSVTRTSHEESEAYFRTRPYGARVSAAASAQSRPVKRADLEAEVRRLRAEHPEAVPLPAWWGGYRLRPDAIEFWQGREDRLHDRVRYRLIEGRWQKERLAP